MPGGGSTAGQQTAQNSRKRMHVGNGGNSSIAGRGAPGCGPGGRGFQSRRSPLRNACGPPPGQLGQNVEYGDDVFVPVAEGPGRREQLAGPRGGGQRDGAAVGGGGSSLMPCSSPRSTSFCMRLTPTQASPGRSRTSGPRARGIGDP